MARIVVVDAQAWAEPTKLQITVLDPQLLGQVETQVLTRLDGQLDISTWVDPTTTPAIVKSVLAMLYVAWFYDRQYSEEQEALNAYAILLRGQAESLLVGILDGSIAMDPTTESPSDLTFYPTDSSSAMAPTLDDMSLGDAKFSMGRVF
jgi:hypothetical protein